MANLQAAAAQAAQAGGGGGGGGGEQLPDPAELAQQLLAVGGPAYGQMLIAELEKAMQGGQEGAAPAAPAAPAEAVASSGRISAQAARGQLS